MKRIIGVLLFIAFVGAQGCAYSEGERTGVITKFSKKGILYKTWEGAMTLGAEGASGGVENTWWFSIDKSEQFLIEELGVVARSGKLVTLGYKEIIPRPFWKGDTGYLVTHIVKDTSNLIE